MAYNLSRKVVVLAGIENTYGQNPTLTPASHAIWSFDDMNPAQPDLQLVDRQPVRGSLTKFGNVVGRSLVNVNPKCVLQGSGAGATEPYICRLLRACGLKAVSGSSGGSTSRILTPRSSSFESLALEVYYEKIKTEVLGAFGTAVIEGNAGAPIDVTFNFKGKYPAGGIVSGSAPVGMVYPPGSRTQMQSEGLAFGSYSSCLIKSFRLDLGVVLSERPDANSPFGFAGILITDRNPKMNIVFEAEDDLSANRDFFDMFQDGAMSSAVSLTHGSAALGSKIAISAPTPQIRNVQWGENNGLRTYVVDLDLVSATDDGEYSIVFTDQGT